MLALCAATDILSDVLGSAEKLVEESVESDPRVAALEDRSLMVLDDDAPFRARLARALSQRGFDVASLGSVSEARDHLRKTQPAFAVVDLRLEDGSGLEIVEALQRSREDAHAVILTGYGAIATAVAAVKAGAIDYLPKPADVEDIVNALLTGRDNRPEPPENPMSADRVRWEHIQRVYELCNHNVSETARRLNMHRRTLQRILAKRAPR
jgi:two-component system, response regulator RegA